MTEIHVEHLLESLDASANRPIKPTLRARLIAQHAEQSRPAARHLRLVLGPALGLLLVLVLVVSPAFAQDVVVTIVQVFSLGDQTSFTSVEGNFEVTESEDGSRQITALSDEDVQVWIEAVPPVEEASESLETYSTEADVASAPGLQVPSYVPDGLFFSSAYYDVDEGSVEYMGQYGEFLGIRQVHGRGIQVTSSSDIPVEEITINGHPATLSRPSDFEVHLLWEAGDTSYEMTTNGISVDEAVKVAESLP